MSAKLEYIINKGLTINLIEDLTTTVNVEELLHTIYGQNYVYQAVYNINACIMEKYSLSRKEIEHNYRIFHTYRSKAKVKSN